MDVRRDSTKGPKQPPEPVSPGIIYELILVPLQVTTKLIAEGFDVLKTLAVPIVPLLVCLFLVPIAAFFSVAAGWNIWHSAAVGWESSLDLQYGDGGPPYAEVGLPVLVAQQPYDISLDLVLPATESNFALGNFMTSLTLTSASNRTLTFVRRPAIAAPPSAGMLSRAPSLVNLHVSLLVAFVPGTSNVKARVEIGRRDGWRSLGRGEGRELAVMEASLRGVVHHKGIRGLITRFPLFTAAISTIMFFVISLLMLAACILPTISRGKMIQTLPLEDEMKTESSDSQLPLRPVSPRPSDSGYSEDERPSRRVRRPSREGDTSRRRSRPVKTEVKEEDASTSTMPPADSDPKPSRLRKRRSSHPEKYSDSE